MAINIPLISTFDNKGVKGAIKEFKSLEGAGAKAQYVLGKASKVAGTALLGLAGAAAFAAKAAAEDQQSQIKLADALRKTGKATDAQIASSEAFISNLSQAAAVTDDELRPAMANLVRATGSATAAQDALAIATDVAAATGMSVESVSKALAKAYAGNTTALKKLNPQLGNLIDKGASASEINKTLTKQFGGSAAKATETAAGRMKQLQIAVGEAQESIGAALLPVIEAIAPKLASFAKWAQDNPDTFKKIALAIGGVAAAIVAINVATKIYTAVTAVASGVSAAFNAILAANPIVLIVLGIMALIAVLVVAYKKFEGFRNVVDTVFNALKAGAGFVYDAFKSYVDLIIGIWKGLFNFIADGWNNTVGKLGFKFPDWVPGFGGKGFDVPDIPKFADGGIVNSPTLALIGEAGPEAVVPLNRANGMGANVTINVNGGDPQAVVDALRRYMRTNGAIPIRTTGVA